jgi:hypothetical protein
MDLLSLAESFSREENLFWLLEGEPDLVLSVRVKRGAAIVGAVFASSAAILNEKRGKLGGRGGCNPWASGVERQGGNVMINKKRYV